MSIPCDFDDPNLLDDFEFLMDDFRSELDWSPTSENNMTFEPSIVSEESSTTGNVVYKEKNEKRKPRKSSAAKSVSKVSSAEMVVTKKSETADAPRLKWYVFPSFDRSDSTIYFASSFARMTNSGDEEGLGKLITNHCAKDTMVVLREDFSVPLAMYIGMLNTINLIHPDSVCCMHSTWIDGNKIHAVLYSKTTDSAEMYDHRASIVEPRFAPFFVGKRKDLFIRNMGLHSLDEGIRNPILKLLDLNVDFQIYSKIDITLTLHDRTKKIVDFSYSVNATSIFYDGVHYPTK